MSIDYVSMRNTLDQGSLSLFRGQISNVFTAKQKQQYKVGGTSKTLTNYATEYYSALRTVNQKNALTIKQLPNAKFYDDKIKNAGTSTERNRWTQEKQAAFNTWKQTEISNATKAFDPINTRFDQVLSQVLGDFGEVFNKFVSTNKGYENYTTNLKNALNQAAATGSAASTAFSNAFNQTFPSQNIYQPAPMQASKRFNTEQLNDYFKQPLTEASQSQYRNTLAQRLNQFAKDTGYSNALSGAIIGGDARFEENALKQTLTYLRDDLRNLQPSTSQDRLATKLADLVDQSLQTGVVSQELGSLLGNRSLDDQKNIEASLASFDMFENSMQTIRVREEERAAAEQAALEARQAEEAQARAVEAKRRSLLKRGTDSVTSSLRLSQSLRGDTASGTDDTSTGAEGKLGQLGTYGK